VTGATVTGAVNGGRAVVEPFIGATRRVGAGVAVLGAVAAALVAAGAETTWEALALAVYVVALTGAVVLDLRTRRVPNRYLAVVTPVTAACFVMAAIAGTTRSPTAAFLGAGILTLVFATIHLVSPAAFGGADVKIAGMVGFATCWFGLDRMPWLLLWTWLALAIVGLPILRARRRSGRSTIVPFIPFLAAGSVVTILFALG
jgi:leader peptidase (prepilin peptidase) / N-methyltransferase